MTLYCESAQTLEANVLGSLRNPHQETKAYVKAPSERCLNENDYLQGHYYKTDIGQYIKNPKRVPECGLQNVRHITSSVSFSGSHTPY